MSENKIPSIVKFVDDYYREAGIFPPNKHVIDCFRNNYNKTISARSVTYAFTKVRKKHGLTNQYVTFKVIGEELGMSEQQTSTVYHSAMSKLRTYCRNQDINIYDILPDTEPIKADSFNVVCS